MDAFDFDVCVVGAGAVGLACAYALARRDLDVVVLERERAIGRGVSSRNSEVIHAGLYYPTGSLKARLCVEGRRALYAFLNAQGVAYNNCGKLVVATEAYEVASLEAIAAQSRTNGVEGVTWLGERHIKAKAPGIRAVAALWSPESGVFDSHGYMISLRGRIEDFGGVIAFSTPFAGAFAIDAGGFTVKAGGANPTTTRVRFLVIAAGLGAQTAASRIDDYPTAQVPALRYGKGVYFRLLGRAPFGPLVYPPPIPGALGTHYRRDLGGQAVFGPDLAFVDQEDYTVDPKKVATFETYIRRFWPGLPDHVLVPDYAGVRPKIHGPGEPQPDFRIDGPEVHGLPGLVTLFGIESPGLTSSLAIGDEVARRLGH
jgi:L-2-hydroxyglutarate oxidase LhgO